MIQSFIRQARFRGWVPAAFVGAVALGAISLGAGFALLNAGEIDRTADYGAALDRASWTMSGETPAETHAITGMPIDGGPEAKASVVGVVEIVESGSVMLLDVRRILGDGFGPTDAVPVSCGTTVLNAEGKRTHAKDFVIGDVIELGGMKNPGPDALSVTLVDTLTGEITEHSLLPGDGLMVSEDGAVLEVLLSTHQIGCACRCQMSGVSGTGDQITLACSAGTGTGTTACECACYHDVPCLIEDDDNGFEQGTTKNCARKLIPR